MVLLIGLAGMSFILLGFILNELSKKINTNTREYNIINLIGAGLLVYYSIIIISWPFLILNSVWAITAIWKLGLIFYKR